MCLCCIFTAYPYCILTADGVWTWLNKSISTSEAVPLRAEWPMHGKKKPGHPFFAIWLFWRHFVTLLLMIILPYVCSRDILQLFAKTQIGQRNRNRFFCPYCTAHRMLKASLLYWVHVSCAIVIHLLLLKNVKNWDPENDLGVGWKWHFLQHLIWFCEICNVHLLEFGVGKNFKMLLKVVSYAYQGCIYLIINQIASLLQSLVSHDPSEIILIC